MPLYHGSASLLCMIPCLCSGATLAIGHKFSNAMFWPEVRATKATIIQYVGELCRYLLAAPPHIDPETGKVLDKEHNVKIAFGNGMRPDIWNRFKQRFNIEGIAEFYAATESPASAWNFSRNDFAAGAIGRSGWLASTLLAKRGVIVELDIDTELPKRYPENNDFCKKVQTNEPGELISVLDPNDISASYQGYFGNDKASDSKILRDVLVKGDAYFRTGDIVRQDSEGRLYFCDRIGDTFRWKSENVSTNEVSELMGHHPAITEANVYGVEVHHHDGRAGCAAVTLNREATPQVMSDLAAHVTEGLPKYAVPIFIRVTPEMPSTGNMKQQKVTLKNQGVDPEKVERSDKMYWLKGGHYEPFTQRDWEKLKAGKVKL